MENISVSTCLSSLWPQNVKITGNHERRYKPRTATLRCDKTTRRTFVLPAALMNASSSPRRWLSAPERLSRRLSRSSRDHTLIVITRSINLHSTAPSSPLHQLNTLSRGIKHWEFGGWYEWSSCRVSGTSGNEDEIGSACPQLTPAGRWRDLQPRRLQASAGHRPEPQSCWTVCIGRPTRLGRTELEDAGRMRRGFARQQHPLVPLLLQLFVCLLCFNALLTSRHFACHVFICSSAVFKYCFSKNKFQQQQKKP